MPDLAEPTARTAARWSDLRLRVASAAVAGPVALACLWLGGPAWAVLIAALTAGLLREWLRFWPHVPRPLALLGAAWIIAAGVALVWLRDDPAVGRANVALLVLAVWASDIGAYLCGRLIGGRRLAPRWSPGKTWAGALGGVAASGAVGAVVAALVQQGAPGVAAGLAMLVSVLAQAGDLLESATKRHAGVKDSGGIIPGHGGLLDRVDGMLAATIPAALLALALGRGVVLWR